LWDADDSHTPDRRQMQLAFKTAARIKQILHAAIKPQPALTVPKRYAV
jgi:hypothetical protein